MTDERVYQADPATCVRVAREKLCQAVVALNDEDPDAALAAVRGALSWLPSFLEKEWDDRMTAWIERAGVPR